MSADADDPIRVRRAQVAKWNRRASRVGYLCFGVALVGFFVGFAVGFGPTAATVVIVALIVGSVLLAPAIIIGYAVKAAEKDDRLHGR